MAHEYTNRALISIRVFVREFVDDLLRVLTVLPLLRRRGFVV